MRFNRPLCATVVGILLLLVAQCVSTGPRRFPLADPLWLEGDMNDVPRRPLTHYLGRMADTADTSLTRPLSQFFRLHLPGEAKNKNSMDEVPNSSWFTNRIGLFPMTPEQLALGPCKKHFDAKGPWVVIKAKPDGATPGFMIKTPDGLFLLKTDRKTLPQSGTAADVIGSKLYWAAGFNVPCNQIVYFRREILKISKTAKTEDKYGNKRKLTQKDVDKILHNAFRLKNGLIRVSISKLLNGKPIGPFLFYGTRIDDPNDVVPHQDRRELRGSRLLAAWLDHWDARNPNTLDMYTKQGGRRFVKHYMLDWADCFGANGTSFIDRKHGHSYAYDFRHVLEDLLTLGIWPRAWHKETITPGAEIFGFYSAKNFVPSKWKADDPTASFQRMTMRDALWMVRIIARFTDAHLRRVVKTGKLTSKIAEAFLLKQLIERRDKILAEYLTRGAPLAHFRLVRRNKTNDKLRQSLCWEDLALKHKVVKRINVQYKVYFYGGTKLDQELGWLKFKPDPGHPGRSCILLPLGDRRPSDLAPTNAPDNHPLRYGLLKIYIHQKPTVRPQSSIWVHFYDLGARRGYRMVGLDRRPKPVLPPVY